MRSVRCAKYVPDGFDGCACAAGAVVGARDCAGCADVDAAQPASVSRTNSVERTWQSGMGNSACEYASDAEASRGDGGGGRVGEQLDRAAILDRRRRAHLVIVAQAVAGADERQ